MGKFTKEEIQKFRKLFDSATQWWRKDEIDRVEFKRILKKIQPEIAPKAWNIVWDLWDQNINVMLNFTKFVKYMYVTYNTTDEFDVFFFVADDDQDGLISEEKFRFAIQRLGLPATKEQIAEAVAESRGFDDELKMNYEQFRKFVSQFVK